ncbi:MAG: acyltransferase family protein [Candidatus Bathyarchaeota archaeon]|nr:acyltransferase family protein [Candidatus Bathyarchaeota archaeon]
MEKNSLDASERSIIPDNLIRTLAITLVILLHAANTPLKASSVPESYWWTAVVYKSIALPCVPLFVMLSGALLLKRTKLNEPIRVFLRKRLRRIGLPIVFWSAVYLAWAFFVSQTPVTWDNIEKGILYSLFGGAYYHFWFIYLIVGIYLITPILRVIIAHGDFRVIRYLCLLWFISVAFVPLMELATGHTVNPIAFVISGWEGYFILGSYLKRVKVQSAILYALLIISFVWTIFGTWLMNYPLSAMHQNNFFFDYLTANVIIGSIALFLILLRFHRDWPGSNHATASRIVQAISRNTLPIFMLHVIILESFERGFFGFTLSYTTLHPIIEIPLITALTLFITLGLILLMRKVPLLKKMIG